ncbi:hypothetical protein GCM10027043_43210 [Ferruginibacter profundus]
MYFNGAKPFWLILYICPFKKEVTGKKSGFSAVLSTALPGGFVSGAGWLLQAFKNIITAANR